MSESTQKKVTLYTFSTSPYGIKVYWALVYKRIPFKIVYVNPLTSSQVSFTGKRIVPVLKVDSKWIRESSDICVWLEELFPEHGYVGETEEEKQEVLKMDDWVTRNIIGLIFRGAVDPDAIERNKGKTGTLIDILRDQVYIPFWFKYIWGSILKRVGFIKRDAAMTDMSKPYKEVEKETFDYLNNKFETTDFIAGTAQPSFADLSLFGQFAFGINFGEDHHMRRQLALNPNIKAWYERVIASLPETIEPSLLPGRTLY